MSITLGKPQAPIWQPDRAPAGTRLYLPISEGAGSVTRDASGLAGRHGTFTGTPAWQMGLYGPQLGGFSTSNYLVIDPPQQILGSIYPCWAACLIVNTSTTASYLFSQGSSSTVTPSVYVRLNNVAGRIEYIITDDAATARTSVVSSTSINDGLPHIIHIVSYTASDHRLHLDGRQVATATGALTTLTNDRLTVGLLRRTTVTTPFGGSVAAFAAGNGAVPDPMALALDWLRGEFTAVRHRRKSWSFAALTAAGGPNPALLSLYFRRRRVG